MNVIELMKIHAANSGFAPSGVTYKPRDDMRIVIPLVEELIAAGNEIIRYPDQQAAERLARALTAIQEWQS